MIGLIVSKLAGLILSKFAGLVLPYTFPLTHQKYKEQALSTFTVIVVLVERNSCNSAGSGSGSCGGRCAVPCTHVGIACKKQLCFEEN